MSYKQGIRYAQEQAQATQTQRVKRLWLNDGDIAKFWFVTDGDDLLNAYVHAVQKVGKGGKPFTIDVLCSRQDINEDPEDKCQLCMTETPGPWLRLFGWVYVESIAHEEKKSEAWKAAKLGQRTIYVEEVNDLWLIIPKFKLQDQVIRRFEEFGTLVDRRYRLERSGAGGQTQENLLPESMSPMLTPDYVAKAKADVSDLVQTVEDQFKLRGKVRARSTDEPVAAMSEEDMVTW